MIVTSIDLFVKEALLQINEVTNFFTCLFSDRLLTCYDRYDSLTSAWSLVTFFAMYRSGRYLIFAEIQ